MSEIQIIKKQIDKLSKDDFDEILSYVVNKNKTKIKNRISDNIYNQYEKSISGLKTNANINKFFKSFKLQKKEVNICDYIRSDEYTLGNKNVSLSIDYYSINESDVTISIEIKNDIWEIYDGLNEDCYEALHECCSDILNKVLTKNKISTKEFTNLFVKYISCMHQYFYYKLDKIDHIFEN